MKIVYNERELLKKALSDGYISKKLTDTIKVIVKHYFAEGLEKQAVRNKVEEFMQTNYKNYNYVKMKDIISKIIGTIYKRQNYTLSNLMTVNITKKEIETIKDLNDLDLEKLAYVLLVHCKVFNAINNNKENFVNSSSQDLFDDAQLKLKDEQQGLMRHKLESKKMIESSSFDKPNNTNLKINYVNEDESGEIVITVTDFENIIYDYIKLKGAIRVANCEGCGDPLKTITSNAQKYCDGCKRLQRNLQQKGRDQEKRNKK